jgi:hypothetical protein
MQTNPMHLQSAKQSQEKSINFQVQYSIKSNNPRITSILLFSHYIYSECLLEDL